MATNTLGFDTETYYHKKTFSVQDLGPWHYTRDPRFDCYMISVSDGAENWSGHPRDFNFDSTKGKILVTQNRAFDEEVALAMEEKGLWPKLEYKEWHCTGNMSAYLWNVRSLSDACVAGLGINISKGTRDRANGKQWDDMVREGWSAEMLQYAALDSQYAVELWDRHSSRWPEIERRLSDLTIRQGRRGVALDADRLAAGIVAMQRVIIAATDNLPWVARGRASGSPIGAAEECRAAGIPCQPVKAHAPEAHEEWLEKYAPQFSWVAALKNLRKATKMLATLETMRDRLRPDGTMPFALLYGGAHTMRWAGTGGVNMQNFNKTPLFIGHDNQLVLDAKRIADAAEKFDKSQPLPDYVKESIDVRGLIVARPGKVLCPSDLANIEPRELNWVVGNQQFLDLVAKGQSPYEAHARTRMGWTGGELKKENKKLYHFAKERVLQLGYGCGWDKFMKRSLLNGIPICDGDREAALDYSSDGLVHKDKDGIEFVKVMNRRYRPGEDDRKKFKKFLVEGCNSRKQVQAFREAEPAITGLWKTLQERLAASVGGDFVMELPSGRCLTYRDVQVQKREAKDEDTGEKYMRTVLTAMIGTDRCVLYGGLLCENLIQAIARDAFAEGMLRLEDAGYPVLFHAHDEAVCEVDAGTDPRKIEELMSIGPAWNEGCPLAAEAKITDRYCK